MRIKCKIDKRGKTIQPQQLNKIFTDCDTQKLLINFENNTIENDLVNNWEVNYYFDVLGGVITFSIDEYDIIYRSLKSFVRNQKIYEVLKKKINLKSPVIRDLFFLNKTLTFQSSLMYSGNDYLQFFSIFLLKSAI